MSSTGEAIVGSRMRSRGNDYPKRVEDVLDRDMKFPVEVVACLKRFSQSKPWRGTSAERQAKFKMLHVALATASGVKVPQLVFAAPDDVDSSRSCYVPALDVIVL